MRMPWAGHKGIAQDTKKSQKLTELLFTRAKTQWWLLGIISFLVIAWMAFPIEYRRNLLNPDDFKEGEKCPRDVFSPIDFNYINKTDIETERQNTLAEVPPVFKINFEKLENAKEQFKIVRHVRSIVSLNDTEKVNEMKRLFYIGPSDAVGFILSTASDEKISLMEKGVLSIISDVLSAGVIANGENDSFTRELSSLDYLKPKWNKAKEKLEIETGRDISDSEVAAMMNINLIDPRTETADEKRVLVGDIQVLTEATQIARSMARELNEPIKTVVEEMAVDLIRPNLVYDSVLTQKRLDNILKDFQPSNQKVKKGDKIIGAGDIVTLSAKEKLKAMALAQEWLIVRAIPGVILIISILTFASIMYIKRREISLFSEPRKVLAIGMCVILVLILGNLIISWGEALKIYRPGFLIPSALASVIIAILVNTQLAIFFTFVVGILIATNSGINTIGSLDYLIVILAGGITAAIYTKHARHRLHLMLVGAYVAGANVLTILALSLLQNVSLVDLGMGCLMGTLNGIAVAILLPGFLPLFEYLSKTTTDMKLLELSDLNQPLLLELKEKAIGSYYHSIDVAKLAEAAAEAIGANPLLTRVGSYYHDLGKMNMPEYFIENQKGENIHDTLNPNMSARVIASHVKDGINIAKQNKLPQIVIDIIQQHVGTTLIGGLRFYQKALEVDRHNTVKIEDFRYPGPRPRTKEAAIVLLADSVESAARVVLQDKNPSYSRLVSFVREIIEGKAMDFQLDESNLTLKDINLIADAFVRVLSGMYHARIEYPKNGNGITSAMTKEGVKGDLRL